MTALRAAGARAAPHPVDTRRLLVELMCTDMAGDWSRITLHCGEPEAIATKLVQEPADQPPRGLSSGIVSLDLSPGLRPGVIGLGLGFCCLTGSVRATEDGPVSGLTAGFHGSGVIRP
ncbi:hypothetical protein AB4Y89_24365, partial [Terriglobus sp. 2YAB30_2]|uniref:hypothetical protein n=1 Tax=Terriglobus sp. 2YAB30_2 TaxID=3233023 RepID=UPI003F94CC1E